MFHQIHGMLQSFVALKYTVCMMFCFCGWDKTVFSNILKVFDNNV